MNEPVEPQNGAPDSVPIGPGEAQRELEEAGWERVERQGKAVWRHPESGHFYPLGAALRRLKMDQAGEDAPPGEPEVGG